MEGGGGNLKMRFSNIFLTKRGMESGFQPLDPPLTYDMVMILAKFNSMTQKKKRKKKRPTLILNYFLLKTNTYESEWHKQFRIVHIILKFYMTVFRSPISLIDTKIILFNVLHVPA